MAYVSVPKDLTKVKNKVAFNLTKRQLICIGIGAAMGIPSYFLLRNVMGNSNAATVMVLLMLPAFLFAMYEKDGMHLEDVLMHMIRVKFLRPPVRKYETENYYETDPEQIRQSPDAGKPKGADNSCLCAGDPASAGKGGTSGVLRGRLRPGQPAGPRAGGLGCDHLRLAGGDDGGLWGESCSHGAEARHGDGMLA